MYRNIIVLPDGTELCAGNAAGDAIKALAFTEKANNGTELAPGCVGVGELSLELFAAAGTAVAAGDALAWYRDGGGRVLMGRFWAEKPTRASANTYKVVAYDAAAKTEKDLSPWLKAVKFPISLYDFAKAVCAQCGLELANAEIPNGSYQIQAFYSDGLTARQLLAWVGQAAGRFCRATPNGKLEFAWYTPADWRHSIGAGEDGLMLVRLAGDTLRVQDGAPPDDGPEIYRLPYKQTWYYQDSLSFEDYEAAAIDKVQINQSDSDVGVVYPADAAGTNALVLSGNLLLTTDTDARLRPVARTLYEQFRDIAYTPCRVSVPAGSGLRAGMAVWVTDANGRTFLTYIMQSTLSGGKVTLESTGSARRDASTAVNRQVQKNLRGKVLELEAGVDGLRLKAGELAGDYTELTATVDGLSSTVTKNKADVDKSLGELQADYTSKIEQSASSITSSVSATYATKDSVQSQIKQSADSITLEASATYATQESLGGYTKASEVRSRFALDPASVEITSGQIAFKSNTITIESDHFKLAKDGSVAADGTFSTKLQDGFKTVVSGNGMDVEDESGRKRVWVSGTKETGGRIALFSGTGTNLLNMGVSSASAGESGILTVKSSGKRASVQLMPGEVVVYGEDNSDAIHLSDSVARFRTPQGLICDGTVACGGLNCKKIRPGDGKNELYVNWVSVQGADGNTYWALCGDGTPWS